MVAQELGLPVFYVGTTESAYLPGHTVCSAEPYVQNLEPLANLRQCQELHGHYGPPQSRRVIVNGLGCLVS